jgi:hypothetical protein
MTTTTTLYQRLGGAEGIARLVDDAIISEQEFLAVTDDIMLAMDKNSIDADSKKDVLAIFYSLKGDIIRV